MFIGCVRGRAQEPGVERVQGLVGELLALNHLGPGDVIAVVVRSPHDPRAASSAARSAGVRRVPVLCTFMASGVEVELHVRLRRRRRVTGIP